MCAEKKFTKIASEILRILERIEKICEETLNVVGFYKSYWWYVELNKCVKTDGCKVSVHRKTSSLQWILLEISFLCYEKKFRQVCQLRSLNRKHGLLPNGITRGMIRKWMIHVIQKGTTNGTQCFPKFGKALIAIPTIRVEWIYA